MMGTRAGGADILALEALTKTYGTGKPAVDAVTLTIKPGTLLALLGPSGCGKTTTLRMIAGLIAPSHGHVRIGSRDVTHVPPYDRNMGLVFQSYALFPHMSVLDNVGFGLKVRGLSKREAGERVAEALRLVRLDGLEARRPNQLSGGQQQRVALARALVIRPDVLLLDEPLSNLDAKLREEMRNEIRDIQRRLGITTVFVTHDQAEAMALADEIAILDAGRLVQIGSSSDIYDRPATPFVARFIGRVNEMAATVRATGSTPLLCLTDGRALPTPPQLPSGSSVRAMVRPHLIEVDKTGADAKQALVGIVRQRTFIGDAVELDIESGGLSIKVEARTGRDRAADCAVGAEVGLTWRPEHTLVFPA